MKKTLKMLVLAIGILGLTSCATDQTVRRNLSPDTTTEEISVPDSGNINDEGTTNTESEPKSVLEKSDNMETKTPVPDSGDTNDKGTTNTQSESKN